MTQRRIRIGLLGCGTVGRGVVELLWHNAEAIAQRSGLRLEVHRILVRDTQRDRGVDRALLTGRPDDVVRNGADIVVETIGGIEPALSLVSAALDAGKPVVTANKRLLAAHHERLRTLASRRRLPLAYEASACAGLPVIRSLSSALAGDRVHAFEGVVNGTSNFILSRLEEGESFESALQSAQRRGFAEADAGADVDGLDAAEKTAILCGEAFGSTIPVENIPTRGIRGWTPEDVLAARRLGFAVRLTAEARRHADGRIAARVGPTLVPRGSALGGVRDELNALIVYGEACGALTFTGRGAGAGPTAAAVVSDILDVARGTAEPCRGPWSAAAIVEPGPESWFVRVRLKPGDSDPAAWLDRFSTAGVGVQQIGVERETHNAAGRVLRLLTGRCTQEQVWQALNLPPDDRAVILAAIRRTALTHSALEK